MSRRPTTLDRPSVFDTGGIAPLEAADATEAEVRPAAKGKTEPEMLRTSIYIPRTVHDALREIAFHERVRVNELLMEGIDQVLAKRRQPSTAELKRKAS